MQKRKIKGCYRVIKAVKRFVEIRANEIEWLSLSTSHGLDPEDARDVVELLEGRS